MSPRLFFRHIFFTTWCLSLASAQENWFGSCSSQGAAACGFLGLGREMHMGEDASCEQACVWWQFLYLLGGWSCGACPTESPTSAPTGSPTAAPTAWEDGVILTTQQDTTIFNPGDEAGNGAGESIFVGTTGQGNVQRSLIQFDIAGNLPAGAVITDVWLYMTLTKAAAGETDRNMTLHKITTEWGEGAGVATGGSGGAAQEGDATWKYTFFSTTEWTNPGGDFEMDSSGEAAVGKTLQPYRFEGNGMVSDVQEWLHNPSSNFGWMMIGTEDQNAQSRQFAPREHPNPSLRPQLWVQFEEFMD